MTRIRQWHDDTPEFRPTATELLPGEIFINYDSTEPGLFFQANDKSIVKVGPCSVGSSPPNSHPPSKSNVNSLPASTGNSEGELWVDTSNNLYTLKVFHAGVWETLAVSINDGTSAIAIGSITLRPQSSTSPNTLTILDANGIEVATFSADGSFTLKQPVSFTNEATFSGIASFNNSTTFNKSVLVPEPLPTSNDNTAATTKFVNQAIAEATSSLPTPSNINVTLKAGAGLTVSSDGSTSVNWSASPVATTLSSGVVKVGSGLQVDGTGTVSATPTESLTSLSLTGTGGTGTIQLLPQSAITAPASGAKVYLDANGNLAWLQANGSVAALSNSNTGNRVYSLPDVSGVVALTSSNITGTAANVTGVVSIANGGTGETSAPSALNALLPSQTNKTGTFLSTDGTTALWSSLPTTVSSVNGKTGDVTLQAGDVGSYSAPQIDALLAAKQNALGFTALNAANNLSDLSNPVVARENLGLGGVANVDTTNPANIVQSPNYRFVTDVEVASWNAKQGVLSFTPLNPANNLTDLSNVKQAITNLGLSNVVNVDTTNPSNINQDSVHRFVSDSQISTWTGKQDALTYTPQDSAQKGVANGYASLDQNGTIFLSQLPTTTGISEGSNLYFTPTRVLQTPLTALDVQSVQVAANDSLVTAIGKLQGQVNSLSIPASALPSTPSIAGLTINGTNTAIGTGALTNASGFTNVTAIGANAQVTGSNQLQLGDLNTTVFAYSIQTRSDSRDKTDIRDTQLGLNFIACLRPVDYKWDYRESSERGRRYHHGLIAQEVLNVIATTGIDFGGFQDHTINGGEDVLSLGYQEFIAPLIKAVQELKSRVEALEAKTNIS